MNYDPDEVRAYQLSGSELDIDEWLERRRGDAAPKAGVTGTPTRRPSIPSKRVEIDGHKFASKTEGRYYEYLKAGPHIEHVDVHPVFTLSTGRRYQADFLVWFTHGGRPRAVEVKGFTKGEAWRRFQLIREDFDSHHPLSPLRVVVWKDKRWQEV